MTESHTEFASLLANVAVEEVFQGRSKAEVESAIASGFRLHGVSEETGQGAFVRLLEKLRAGFSDVSFDITEVIQQGDLAAIHYRWAGTHTGEIWGVAATGRRIESDGVDMVRIKDGKVTDYWPGGRQALSALAQMGVLPMGPDAR